VAGALLAAQTGLFDSVFWINAAAWETLWNIGGEFVLSHSLGGIAGELQCTME
jgi:hypothetical protein